MAAIRMIRAYSARIATSGYTGRSIVSITTISTHFVIPCVSAWDMRKLGETGRKGTRHLEGRTGKTFIYNLYLSNNNMSHDGAGAVVP